MLACTYLSAALVALVPLLASSKSLRAFWKHSCAPCTRLPRNSTSRVAVLVAAVLAVALVKSS